MPYLADLFETTNKRFERHISPKENCRIIFSGSYGSGKTTFLTSFFNDRNFEVIRLFPVSYSIAKNEDILNYIKYDILIELIKKGVDFESIDLKLSHKTALYAKSNWMQIAINVLKAAVSVGKNLLPGTDNLETIFNFFEKEHNSINNFYDKNYKETFDESAVVESFINKIKKEDSGFYEDSIVSKIIESKIESIKIATQNNRQTVLIIDDLDRIDPEHIFRILNIFAAHFDLVQNKTVNKFGFDKIILVCDIENIRSVFHHKYGNETNFGGYIDKFYTDDIFNFNIVEVVAEKIVDIMKTFKAEHSPLKGQYSIIKETTGIFGWLTQSFIKQGSLNIRSLTKFVDRDSLLILPESKYFDGIRINTSDEPLLWNLMILSRIFGEKFSFLSALQKLELYSLGDSDINTERIFRRFLTLATVKQHGFHRSENSVYYVIEKTNRSLTYDINFDHENMPIKNISWEDHNNFPSGNEFSENLVPLMYQTVRELYKLDFLQ